MEVVRINHCCFIIRNKGTVLLTDPFFVPHENGMITPKVKLEVDYTALKEFHCDGILLSHAHLDHFSEQTLKNMNKSISLFYPAGDRDLRRKLDKLEWQNLIEFEPTVVFKVNDVEILPTPSEALNKEVGFLIRGDKVDFWHTVDSIITNKSIKFFEHYFEKPFVGTFTYKFMNEFRQREISDSSKNPLNQEYYDDSLFKVHSFPEALWICLDQGWYSPLNPSFSQFYQAKKPLVVVQELLEQDLRVIHLEAGDQLNLESLLIQKKSYPQFIEREINEKHKSYKDKVLSWDFDETTCLKVKRTFIEEVFYNVYLQKLINYRDTKWFQQYRVKDIEIRVEVFYDHNTSENYSFNFLSGKWSPSEGTQELSYLHYKTCYGALLNLSTGEFDYGNLAAAGLFQLVRNESLEQLKSLRFFDIARLLVPALEED